MAQTTSAKTPLRYGLPDRVAPLRLFPPLCLLPGHRPAHDTRCFSVGKRLICVPINGRIAAAAVSCIPTILWSRVIASENGRSCCSISLWTASMDSSKNRCGSASAPAKSVDGAGCCHQALCAIAGNLTRSRPRANSASASASCSPPIRASIIKRLLLPNTSAAVAANLILVPSNNF